LRPWRRPESVSTGDKFGDNQLVSDDAIELIELDVDINASDN
jgi:hypothetical protein